VTGADAVTASPTVFGIDLHVDLTSSRVRAGLEGALREAVRSGLLVTGTRLPSSRQLAADLGLARNTVADAYGQLVAEGWLTARQGSGTRVADLPSPARAPATPPPRTTEPGYDLRSGVPTLASFPATAWVTALRRALHAAPADALGYTDVRGRPELRQALASHLARTRGVRACPDGIVVCSGFTQGLSLLARVLHQRGATTVATEEYAQPAHRDVLAAQGLASRPLPVDVEGALVDRLGDEDAVLLTPAHQFPLGPTLSTRRRSAVLTWAADTGGLVIEDDYDGEFRHDRHSVGALQGRGPHHVVHVGTTSKTLAPGVRLGWLVAPPDLVDDLVEAKRTTDLASSSLDQLALARLITDGGYDKHVRRSRHVARRRRDELLDALHRQAPAVQVDGIAAGLHTLVLLPGVPTDARPQAVVETDAVASAARHGLAVEGLQAYRHPDSDTTPRPAALVVGLATPPDHAYSGALTRLAATLNELPALQDGPGSRRAGPASSSVP